MIGAVFETNRTIDVGIEMPWEPAKHHQALNFVGYSGFDQVVTLNEFHSSIAAVAGGKKTSDANHRAGRIEKFSNRRALHRRNACPGHGRYSEQSNLG